MLGRFASDAHTTHAHTQPCQHERQQWAVPSHTNGCSNSTTALRSCEGLACRLQHHAGSVCVSVTPGRSHSFVRCEAMCGEPQLVHGCLRVLCADHLRHIREVCELVLGYVVVVPGDWVKVPAADVTSHTCCFSVHWKAVRRGGEGRGVLQASCAAMFEVRTTWHTLLTTRQSAGCTVTRCTLRHPGFS